MGCPPACRFCISGLLLLFSRSVVSDSSPPCGPWPTRLLCSWDFPGKKSSAVSCHFPLQGIFRTQGLNPCLLNWHAGS